MSFLIIYSDKVLAVYFKSVRSISDSRHCKRTLIHIKMQIIACSFNVNRLCNSIFILNDIFSAFSDME